MNASFFFMGYSTMMTFLIAGIMALIIRLWGGENE